MPLPYDRSKLERLNPIEMYKAILDRRKVIRWHRDQKLDDRCWVDDFAVWEMLDDSPVYYHVNPRNIELVMTKCIEFWEYRRSETPDAIPINALRNRMLWDSDLRRSNEKAMLDKLVEIQMAIKAHRDHMGVRTLTQDRHLYSILPEKLPADFRLGPREKFLGEARAPKAGCPSFWRSHATCRPGLCSIRVWGPCKDSPYP